MQTNDPKKPTLEEEKKQEQEYEQKATPDDKRKNRETNFLWKFVLVMGVLFAVLYYSNKKESTFQSGVRVVETANDDDNGKSVIDNGKQGNANVRDESGKEIIDRARSVGKKKPTFMDRSTLPQSSGAMNSRLQQMNPHIH